MAEKYWIVCYIYYKPPLYLPGVSFEQPTCQAFHQLEAACKDIHLYDFDKTHITYITVYVEYYFGIFLGHVSTDTLFYMLYFVTGKQLTYLTDLSTSQVAGCKLVHLKCQVASAYMS